ncbi:carbonic anhydrase, partial [Myxococcota bacterium]|nr:carbonic anhydrase [Myxococcota bacterium]
MSDLTESQKAILDNLMAGNERYVSGRSEEHDYEAARKILKDGQSPGAAVIRCADSRVAPELVFDQSLGELFVCGVAGNIPTAEILASLEYAVANLG